MKLHSATIAILLAVSAYTIGWSDEETPEPAKTSSEQMWCQYEGRAGPGNGKHIVLIAGDDEYRSEEALPMLGKILAVRHGFKCTVLFPINQAGKIQPDHQTNIPGLQFLKSADVVVLGLRFRNLPDEQMKQFVDYVESGKPIIGLRTSTHAFKIPSHRKYSQYSFDSKKEGWKGGFGQRVLGDTWIAHHGKHGKQSTRGVINEKFASHHVMTGVQDAWGPSDVYAIKNLPADAKVLMHGQVLDGMTPKSGPAPGKVNNLMMPLVWVRDYATKSGKKSRIFCTTMGAATDFESAGLRKLIVNAVYWAAGLEGKIKEEAKVEFVDPYQPTDFGFGNFQKNRTPVDYELKAAAR